MPKSQLSCVRPQHPLTQWNRGVRWSSVEYSTEKIYWKNPALLPSFNTPTFNFSVVIGAATGKKMALGLRGKIVWNWFSHLLQAYELKWFLLTTGNLVLHLVKLPWICHFTLHIPFSSGSAIAGLESPTYHDIIIMALCVCQLMVARVSGGHAGIAGVVV